MRKVQKRLTLRPNVAPNIKTFSVFFVLFFGQSSNSLPWLVFVCVYQAKQKMWNNYATAEMQLLLCCLRPDQRCKKNTHSYHLKSSNLIFLHEETICQYSDSKRQFHIIDIILKKSGCLFKNVIWFQKFQKYNIYVRLDVCLRSSTSLTLYDALVLLNWNIHTTLNIFYTASPEYAADSDIPTGM